MTCKVAEVAINLNWVYTDQCGSCRVESIYIHSLTFLALVLKSPHTQAHI
jgi:hypothetical protein